MRIHGGWDALDGLESTSLIGFGIPWCGSEVETAELEEHTLFDARPRADLDARGRLAVVRTLTGAGAEIVLLPELSLPVDHVDEAPAVRMSRVGRREVAKLPFAWLEALSGPQKP